MSSDGVEPGQLWAFTEAVRDDVECLVLSLRRYGSSARGQDVWECLVLRDDIVPEDVGRVVCYPIGSDHAHSRWRVA